MSMSFAPPSEIIALSITIIFIAIVVLVRKADKPFYNELIPWVFYIIGWFCCVYNIQGTTINYDFLHLALISFTMGLSLQLDQLRCSSRN